MHARSHACMNHMAFPRKATGASVGPTITAQTTPSIRKAPGSCAGSPRCGCGAERSQRSVPPRPRRRRDRLAMPKRHADGRPEKRTSTREGSRTEIPEQDAPLTETRQHADHPRQNAPRPVYTAYETCSASSNKMKRSAQDSAHTHIKPQIGRA